MSDTNEVLAAIDSAIDNAVVRDPIAYTGEPLPEPSDELLDASLGAPETDPVLEMIDLFGPVISAYTRADAIRDGVLVEVPASVTAEAGIRIPIALTQAAWANCVAWDESDNDRKGICNGEAGRLWDVVWMTRVTMQGQPDERCSIVRVCRVPRPGDACEPREIRLILTIGPGDDGMPVLTLALPSEDL